MLQCQCRTKLRERFAALPRFDQPDFDYRAGRVLSRDSAVAPNVSLCRKCPRKTAPREIARRERVENTVRRLTERFNIAKMRRDLAGKIRPPLS
jgi:hypothetical protein